eukprot:UN33074
MYYGDAKTGGENTQLGSFAKYAPEIETIGGCFLEVIAKDDQVVEEARWARKNLPDNVVLVPRIDFSKDTKYVEKCFSDMLENKNANKVVGIRHILNYEPTWPKTPKNWIKDDTWKKNYQLLEKYNLNFDCQANPHQLMDCAEFFAKHPKIPVIVNHLGTPKNPDDEKEMKQWEDGMKALAKLKHVYVKISMLYYTDKEGWDKKDDR